MNILKETRPGRYYKSSSCRKKEGQTRISCPSVLVNSIQPGIDTLHVSIHANIENYSVFDDLKFIKKQLQAGFGTSLPFNFGQKEYFRFNLNRIGTKFYPYVLTSGDITLLLSSRSVDSQIPNIKIEIGSISSQDDLFGVYYRLLHWLKVYGFTVEREIISRVDVAVDCIGQNIIDLDINNQDKWISRARKFSIFYENRKLTGVMLGKGQIALRVYDKITELQKDLIKLQFFRNLWKIPEEINLKDISVTRFEFQFRRSFLKELAIPITTVQDLKKNIDSLWQYATKEWTRFSENIVDRISRNQDKAKIAVIWKKIQNIVFNFPALPNKRTKKKLQKNLIALRAQARGCILNLVAACGHEPDDFFGIMNTISTAITDDFSDFMIKRFNDFYKLLEQRKRECFVGF